jgi:hypothetical protein
LAGSILIYRRVIDYIIGRLIEDYTNQAWRIIIDIIIDQWEFQDPKMELLYHIRPYFGGISPYIGLT